MLSQPEFAQIFNNRNPKAYKSYTTLHSSLNARPEATDILIQSGPDERRRLRAQMADMLIEITDEEINKLIELIELVK